MKICIVAPFADPEKGAAVVRLNSFTDYFKSQGHKVTILAPVRGDAKAYGVTRYGSLWQLLRLMVGMDIDVAIGVSPPITHAFFSMLACKLRKKPFVLDSKDIFSHTAVELGLMKRGSIKYFAYCFVEKQAHIHADSVLVLNGQIGNVIREKYFLRKEKICVAMNGVDTRIVRRDVIAGQRIRKRLNVPEGKKLIIYMGGLGDERYLDFIDNSAQIIKDSGAHILFLVACDDSDVSKNQIEQLTVAVSKNGLQKQFHMVINVPHKDVFMYLSAADIGVDFWPDFEYFAVPVKVLEYMACQLPVVIKSPKVNRAYEYFFSKYDAGYSSTTWQGFRKGLKDALLDSSARAKGAARSGIISRLYTREKTNRKVLGLLQLLTAK